MPYVRHWGLTHLFRNRGRGGQMSFSVYRLRILCFSLGSPGSVWRSVALQEADTTAVSFYILQNLLQFSLTRCCLGLLIIFIDSHIIFNLSYIYILKFNCAARFVAIMPSSGIRHVIKLLMVFSSKIILKTVYTYLSVPYYIYIRYVM